MEIWKPVKDYEGLYSVSSLGRVRSEQRTTEFMPGRHRIVPSRLLSPASMNGYPQVCLYRDGKRKTIRVHRLVAEAFVSNPDNHTIVNHKDGVKDNNVPANLEWCTVLENNIHAFENGLNATGERHHNASLTDTQVQQIRTSYTGAYGQISSMAREYGVTPGSIWQIVNNKSRTY
jgi:hypothetical protein